jgi:lysophospholipase L1-like esterase
MKFKVRLLFGVFALSLFSAGILAQLPAIGQNATGNLIKILPFGESTTDGGTLFSYRKALSDSLIANNVSFDFIGSLRSPLGQTWDIDHQGMSGMACRDLGTWIKANSTTYKADIILLWEGTNDCGWGWQWYGTPISALSTLIDDICANQPQAELFVSTIPVMGANAYASSPWPVGASANAYATTYNAAMPALIDTKIAQGKKVHFVDARGVLTLNDLTDGIHPNQAGYNKMAPCWFNAIKPYLGLNTGIESSTKKNNDSVKIYTIDNQIVADLSLFIGTYYISIYDIQGKQLFSKKKQGGKVETLNSHLYSGIYIVTINNEEIQQSTMVFVR